MGSGVSYGDQGVRRAIIGSGSARGKEAPPQYAAHRMVARRRKLSSFTAFGCLRSNCLVRVLGRIAGCRCRYFVRVFVRLVGCWFGRSSGFRFLLCHCLFQARGAVVMMAAAWLAYAHFSASRSGGVRRRRPVVVGPGASRADTHAESGCPNIGCAEANSRPRHAALVVLSMTQAAQRSSAVRPSAAISDWPVDKRTPAAAIGGLSLD